MARFQFLIGTIKTILKYVILLFKKKFQFLIGTIKTTQHLPGKRQAMVVSIPYRYYKNDFENEEGKTIRGSFQFLIGTIKTCILLAASSTFFTFQFLIGTIKTSSYKTSFLF